MVPTGQDDAAQEKRKRSFCPCLSKLKTENEDKKDSKELKDEDEKSNKT